MHQNTRAIASIWRGERVASRSVSARRILQKRALNGHFWTTKGRLAVNWDLESAKFCHEAFFQGRLPLYANFWPASMKNWNRQKIVFLLIQIFHLGDSKDRPQNGLYTIVELIFLMQHKTKGMATIWRWEHVAAISVSARRRSQKWLKFGFLQSGDGKNRSQIELSDNVRVKFFSWSRRLRRNLQNDTSNVFWL